MYQFRISLLGIAPEIWRRIIVPERYSFWDLHVAIQDALGWLDCHLHVFEIADVANRRHIEIGIPDEDSNDDLAAGWEVGISAHFTRPGQVATYVYDFGDSWRHQVVLEGILLGDGQGRYPRCIAGERACPPEDCGGAPGYERLLAILANPEHEEYEETLEWLDRDATQHRSFDPDAFAPERARFSNPKQRWEMAFGSDD